MEAHEKQDETKALHLTVYAARELGVTRPARHNVIKGKSDRTGMMMLSVS
jgi:hypothetical protein